MRDLLKKIGLLENLSLELSIGRSDFVNILAANIDRPQNDFFDIFRSSKNIYKGSVTYDGFELKRKKSFVDGSAMVARANGKFTQRADRLIIDVEVNGFHYMIIPFLIVTAVIYIFSVVMILGGNIEGNVAAFAIPFVLLHAAFMFGIPYFLMRRGVRAAIYNLERDIYFMMKDKLSSPHQR